MVVNQREVRALEVLSLVRTRIRMVVNQIDSMRTKLCKLVQARIQSIANAWCKELVNGIIQFQ